MRWLLLFFAAPVTCAASSQVLLSADTESPLKGGMIPPRDVVQVILRGEPDDVPLLNECMVEKEIGPKSAATLFTAKALHLNSDGVVDYFVRPALAPYCHVFYGAHLFRYWLVTSHRKHGKVTYKIAFKSGGDEARVLPSMTNGYHDLELMGHTAVVAQTSIWRFNGKEYRQAGCTVQVMGDNGWTDNAPCPSEEGGDNLSATPQDPSPSRASTSPRSPPPAAGG